MAVRRLGIHFWMYASTLLVTMERVYGESGQALVSPDYPEMNDDGVRLNRYRDLRCHVAEYTIHPFWARQGHVISC